MRLGHLPERVVVELELPGVGGWPGNAVRGEPALPAFLPETAAFEHAIVAIDFGNQFVLDSGPVTPQQVERHGIDRDAVPLDRRRRLHEPSAQQGARQVDARQHGGQQPLQQQHVAFAVVQVSPRDRRRTKAPRPGCGWRKSRFSVTAMPSMPKNVGAPSRPAPFGSVRPLVWARNSVNRSRMNFGCCQLSALKHPSSALA